jgi:hypothetical protein
MYRFYAHLISDSTGDTVSAVARAVLTRFDDIEVKYYLWALIRTEKQLERIVNIAKKKTGVIVHTLSNPKLNLFLKELAERSGILCIDALESVTEMVSRYLHKDPVLRPGRLHALDKEYFKRIEAINFTIAHDDWQSPDTLSNAEIILIGPSRTSKSPTAMYLAHKGFKTANIPFISGIKLELDKENLANVFVVGLYASMDRLIDVRRSRLLSLNSTDNAKYVGEEFVRDEIQEAKKFYLSHDIPIIDVTNKAIEETAAKIIQLYHLWKMHKEKE